MKESVISDPFERAWLAAYSRALESERPGALFHDPYARRLAGQKGEELMRIYPRARREVWAIALRTRMYDEILLRIIEQEQVDTVINLSAGLDARPYRLPLPVSLRWIEVDLPNILHYKEEVLANEAPICTLERVPLDITDSEARKQFLSHRGQDARRALVLIEGFLVYLKAGQVAAIADDLYAHTPIRWLLTAFVARLTFPKDEQPSKDEILENAQKSFASSNSVALFRHHGWNIAEFHPAVEAVLRFNVPLRFRWLLRLLARIAPAKPGISLPQLGFALLERTPSNEVVSQELHAHKEKSRCDESTAKMPEEAGE